MANPLGAVNLGNHLGSRHPAHIARWVQAGVAARRAMPKCEGIAKQTGARCRHIPLAGKRFCIHHIRGAEAHAADLEKEQRNAKILAEGDIPINEERARKSMARIARRRTHRAWRIDPRAPNISTLEICKLDEQRVRAWLIDFCSVDLDKPLHGLDREATARCRDRLRWAAWRVLRRGKNASDDFVAAARLRVAAAIRDDLRFWEMWDRLEGDE
jgi:hypothetical protein